VKGFQPLQLTWERFITDFRNPLTVTGI